jgi:hypothetical protein
LNYTHHPETKGLGEIGAKGQNQRGFGLHTTLAVTPEGGDVVTVCDREADLCGRKSNGSSSEANSACRLQAMTSAKNARPRSLFVTAPSNYARPGGLSRKSCRW